MKRILTLAIIVMLKLGATAQGNAAGAGSVTLISPYDGQVITTFYPSFFWTFAGLTGDYDVQYSIKVTELKEGQTYTDAIQYNPPLVFEQNLLSAAYMYPTTAFSLNEDKKYVWQIEATVGGRIKYLSEIWMFRFKKNDKDDKNEEEKKKKLLQYVFLSKKITAAAHLYTDRINFRYNNETADTLLNYTIQKVGEDDAITLTEKPVTALAGINYYSFEIPRGMARGSKKGDTYLLLVKNSRKETWMLKFCIGAKSKKK